MTHATFRACCSTGSDWESIAEDCLGQLAAEQFVANFGFLYVTDELALGMGNLLERLCKATGISDWIGTVGTGICCTGREIYDQPAAAVMLAAFPDDSYRLLRPGIREMTDMLESSHHWLADRNVHVGIVHGDPRNNVIQQLIESLSSHLDPGFLVGGLTSASDEHFMQQIAGEICEGGLSGVLLSSDIPVVSGLTQGCMPLGRKHIITACQGNLLSELDGKPALDVFREDIGEVLSHDLSRVAGYIFAGIPVPGSDTGDYLVRNLIGIDPQEKLIAIGDNLEEEAGLMFCRRDGDAAREDMLRMLSDLGRRVTGDIRGGLYFSCLGRGRHQFGDDSEELRMIRDQLGDFPLVGFFANGEISHNRLYGYTGVLTLFV